jgi:transketolase
MTDGVEVTTGPLGQGIANAVGLAISETHLAATYNRIGFKLFDNYTFCIVGDGCLQEGIAAEAMSLAGHLKLNKLIVFYDDNKIQIDGETDLAFTENVAQRVASYGFHVLTVENGDADTQAIYNAIETAKTIKDKPVFIQVHTTIGFGSSKQGTEKVHGSPLGDIEIVSLKKQVGFDPEAHFVIPQEVQDYFDSVKSVLATKETQWQSLFTAYRNAFPGLAAELIRRLDKKLPENLLSVLPTYKPTDAPVATRKLSENVLNAIADKLPELIGGSADLTGSNLTRWKSATDFQPVKTTIYI